jgi:hypothetical protein
MKQETGVAVYASSTIVFLLSIRYQKIYLLIKKNRQPFKCFIFWSGDPVRQHLSRREEEYSKIYSLLIIIIH